MSSALRWILAHPALALEAVGFVVSLMDAARDLKLSRQERDALKAELQGIVGRWPTP